MPLLGGKYGQPGRYSSLLIYVRAVFKFLTYERGGQCTTKMEITCQEVRILGMWRGVSKLKVITAVYIVPSSALCSSHTLHTNQELTYASFTDLFHND